MRDRRPEAQGAPHVPGLWTLFRARRALFAPRVRRRLAVVAVGTTLIGIVEFVATLLVPAMVGVLTSGSLPGRFADIAWILGTSDRAQLTVRLTLIVVSVFVAKDVLVAAFRWWMLGFIEQSQADASSALLEAYLQRTPYEGRRESAPEMLRLLTGAVSALYNGIVVTATSMASEFVTLVVMIIAMQVILPGPAFLVLLTASLVAVSTVFLVSRLALKAGAAEHSASLDTYRLMNRAIGGFKELRLRGTAPRLVSAYSAAALRAAASRRVVVFLAEAPRYLLESVVLLAVGVTVALSADAPVETVAALGTLVVICFRALPALHRLVGGWASVRSSLPAAVSVVTMLDEGMVSQARRARAASDADPSRDLPPGPSIVLRDGIELRIDHFSYGEGRPAVLRDLHGLIESGARIAVAGSSGAGKSTLMDVLCGIITSYDGDVLVDGESLRGREAIWRRSVAVVSQDPYITEATVRENIMFDIGEVEDPELMVEVVRQAQLDDVVEGFPHGLDTIIGEGGRDISGGQRQRIAIARALYRKASFLVLDEATSSLDDDNESAVLEAILGLPPEVTVVCVAHRLSTILSMAKVAFMEEGAVAAYGPPSEVLASSAAFRRWIHRTTSLLDGSGV